MPTSARARGRDRPARGERSAAANDRRRTVRGLEQSLQSTAAGLELMLRSLRESGFAEALGPYRQMQLVLAQQRAWARTQSRGDLDIHWRKIAGTAGDICRLLTDMATIMSAIESIETCNLEDEEAAADSRDDEKAGVLVGQLLDSARLSPRWASSRGIDPKTLEALAQSGIVEPAGWGRGRTYRLSEKALGHTAARFPAVDRRKKGGT